MLKIGDALFSYRWLVGIMLLALCVLGEIHGSSIGIYSALLGTPTTDVFGHSRAVRSDEWLVSTPMAFSQYYNNFGYFSDIFRGALSDMFIVYGQAVMDPAVLLRPFHIGYLFLSPGGGLSFFWMGRWIFLFLVSLEFGMLVCNKKKMFALAYAFAIAFSPLIQWWFAVNFVADIFIFGQAGVIFLLKYLHCDSPKKRVVYGLCIAYLLWAYTFSIYPAWQVTMAYVFLAVAAGMILNDRFNLRFAKKDFAILGMSLILLIPLVGHIVHNSLPAVETVNHTVYPGSRFMTSADISINDIHHFITSYGMSISLPTKDVIGTSNNSEAARMFDFAPLGMVAAMAFLWKMRRMDFVLVALMLLQTFFVCWCFIEWPVWFAKVSLMYNVTSRVILGIGLINILLLLRTAALLDDMSCGGLNRLPSALLSMLGVVIAIGSIYDIVGLLLGMKDLLIIGFVAFCGWYFYLRKKYTIFLLLTILVTCYAGAKVNPIAVGTSSVYASPVVRKIAEIAAEDKGLWLVVDDWVSYNNVPIMAGAPTINSTNIYPALERWKILDPEGKNFDLYNRYAHIPAALTHDKTTFEAIDQLDAFKLNLNVNDLKKLRVKYIFATKDLGQLSSRAAEFERLYKTGIFGIYRVNYP